MLTRYQIRRKEGKSSEKPTCPVSGPGSTIVPGLALDRCVEVSNRTCIQQLAQRLHQLQRAGLAMPAAAGSLAARPGRHRHRVQRTRAHYT